MKATSGLLALGLFTLAGVVVVSCGGSSDDGDSDNTAGSSSAGKGTGGGSSGSSSTAGKTGSAGSANTGGTTGTAGTNGNNGGRNNTGGFDQGFGGEFNIDECGDGVIAGMPCERMQGAATACQLDATTYCSCQGNNANATWFCIDSNDVGQGGAGGGDVTCPGTPANGADCSGNGPCPGSQSCFCALGNVYCIGGQQ